MLAPPPLPRTLDASLRDLDSDRAETRASAMADLARHAGASAQVRARALPLLERALREDASPAARSAAAVALADLRAGEALPALLVAIEDVDVHVRQMAINALGEIGDARAATRLSRALGDERPDVRYQAIIAYAKLAEDGADVTSAILRALDDADAAVRYIALRIAEERADEAAAKADARVIARARVLLDPRDEAKRAVTPGDQHVALAAAIFLAKMGEPDGKKLLERVIRGDRVHASMPEKEDEREAVELAGRLDLRSAIPDLERRAWGLKSFVRDTCAWHAKIALARMGHPRATDEILRDLDSSKPDTRAAAIVAAGRAHLVQARSKLEAMRAGGAREIDPELVADALAKLSCE
jgi:HEAT repeat protein